MEISKFKIILTTVLVLVVALSFFVLISRHEQNDAPEIIFFDVGQGDATLIQEGEFQILVDGGPNSAVLSKIGKYMPFWDKTMEVVVLTHGDADHINGLIDVLEKYEVEKVIMSKNSAKNEESQIFDALLESSDVEIEWANLGDAFEYNSISFLVLHPFFEDEFASKEDDLNNLSVAMKVYFNNAPILLLSGDIDSETENKIIEKGLDVSAKIMHANHHGSKYSNSDSWIKAVNPEKVVVSAGEENRYGHPAKEVLERIGNFGAEILRTDEIGDILIK